MPESITKDLENHVLTYQDTIFDLH